MKKRPWNYKDLTGKIFGELKAIKNTDKYYHKRPMWLCLCSCGNYIEMSSARLLSENTKSCGCLKSILYKKENSKNIGKKFNKLLIEDIIYKYAKNETLSIAKCLCDCGNKKNIKLSAVVSGNTKSCGCMNFRKNSNSSLWSGAGSISGKYWKHIISHCKRKSRDLDFKITIEYAWKLFLKQKGKCNLSGIRLEFETQDKLKKERTASLDRIDSNKGYIIGNVQWVHKDINIMKWDYQNTHFIKMCKLVAENNKEKK